MKWEVLRLTRQLMKRKKFNITGKLNATVTKKVANYLHDDSIHKMKNFDENIEYIDTLTDEEKMKIKFTRKIKIFDYHYNNPINALENLKINKSIYDNIITIVNDFSNT
jgi:hypothetical protein